MVSRRRLADIDQGQHDASASLVEAGPRPHRHSSSLPLQLPSSWTRRQRAPAPAPAPAPRARLTTTSLVELSHTATTQDFLPQLPPPRPLTPLVVVPPTAALRNGNATLDWPLPSRSRSNSDPNSFGLTAADRQPDPVIAHFSETLSAQTPKLVRQRRETFGQLLQVPAPISKEPPIWDLFTGTPAVEEEDFFELDRAVVTNRPAPHADVPSPPTTSLAALPPAQNAARLTQDTRPDHWLAVESQRVTLSNPRSAIDTGPQKMPGPANSLQTGHPEPSRQSSFIGLPPIRRTSTFGFGGSRSGDDASAVSSPVAPSEEGGPLDTHGPNGVQSGAGYQAMNGQSVPGQPPYGQFQASPPPGQGFMKPDGQQQPGFMASGPNGIPQMQQPGFVGRGGPPPGAPQPPFGASQAGSSGSGFGPAGMRGPPPGAPGNPITRIPPGQWKLQALIQALADGGDADAESCGLFV